MSKRKASIEMIPIEKIHILNPRLRNQKIFENIVDNIAQVGLKRPITVTASKGTSGKAYDLVCGQGRIEAFLACGQTHIPAVVIDANEEQALIMSLVENCARRHRRAIDLLQGLEILQKQGYDDKTIAAKIGLQIDYVRNVLHLLNNGEERLLSAVESGNMPISVAMQIMDMPDEGAQQALQDAYDNNLLRGKKFFEAKKLLEIRKLSGKSLKYRSAHRGENADKLSAEDIVKVYQKEVDRKRMLTRKAELANSKVLFTVEALRRLLREKGFHTILQTEGLSTLPKPLSEMVKVKA